MIYFFQRADNLIKIGVTGHFAMRRNQLEKRYGPLNLLGWMYGNSRDEWLLHDRFRVHRAEGREWFKPHDQITAYIQENAYPLSPDATIKEYAESALLWRSEMCHWSGRALQAETKVTELERQNQDLQRQLGYWQHLAEHRKPTIWQAISRLFA